MIQFLVSIPAFLFALGVIVLVHELGHHLVAKLFGVRVLTFSIGFGRRIWGFEHGGTDYRIAAVPLGGYVRMAGDLPDDHTGKPDDLLSKPRWQRILIYLAGPAMNVVLSVALIAAVFMHGFPVQGTQGAPPVIGIVGEDSPAEKAGLEPGDRIVAVDGEEVELWNDLEFHVTTSPEKTLRLSVDRDGETFETELVPNKVSRHEFGDAGFFPKLRLRLSVVFEDTPAQRAGFRSGDAVIRVDGEPIFSPIEFVEKIEPRAGESIAIEVMRGDALQNLTVVPDDVDGKGRIGVQLGFFRPLPFGEAVVESVRYNIDIVDKTIQVIGMLLTREMKAKSALSGPIEIANTAGRAAQRGFKDLIFIMGFLSISIGIMNLLPIPLLDGGHITILLIESVMRRDLSMTVKERTSQVGLVMLLLLMAMVIFFDLSKTLPGLFGS
ncbi:MAG: site-2 protease family protein [Acidobacteriota bacterium]